MNDDTNLTTTSDVLDVLGGTTKVAELTGSRTNAVSNWRKAKTFPSNTYVVLSEALRSIGRHAPASLWG